MLLKPEDEERIGASNEDMLAAVRVSNARVTEFSMSRDDVNPSRPDVRIAFVILHALHARERAPIVSKLCDELPSTTYLELDDKGMGSLGPWLDMLESIEGYATARGGATHVCFLPDDCELVPHFAEVITEAVRARPDDLICCQTNHAIAPQVQAAWYTTPDGWSGFGGVMRASHWLAHREWRKTELRPDVVVQGDEGVNLWAMATGRLVYKTLPGLVDHILDVPSVDGNQHQTDNKTVLRRGTVFYSNAIDLRKQRWSGPAAHLGRTYNEMHWKLVTALKKPQVRRAYDVARDFARYTLPR